MRTSIILICIGLTLAGCSKTEVLNSSNQTEQQSTETTCFLNFDIEKVSYGEPDQEEMFVESSQEKDLMILQDVSLMNRHYYLGPIAPAASDSITLLGSIDMVNGDNSTYKDERFRIDFFFTEAKENLIALSDSTYRYESLELFSKRLRDEEWGFQPLFGNHYINQMLLTFPTPSESDFVWDMGELSSNGFYFDYEALTFDNVEYNEESETIELAGAFSVDMKVLSCGYYSFYAVTDAEFLVEIK